MEKITVSMEQLSKIAVKLFMKMGYGEKEAAYAADVLVETDRRGVDTHGVARLGFYHWCLKREGMINRDARLIILRDEPPFLMVDADHGLGIIMAPQAAELALQRAAEHGICVMGIQNSSHFAAAGYYAAKCVAQGFISLVSSNSNATMVPIGGKERIMGNSPWSIAIPGGKRHPEPIIFDMACSEVSRGKCETALREGKQVPIGWGVDSEGAPSTDPDAILNGGSLLPFGGIKGYCISLLVETLSSMLTFASFGNGVNMGQTTENTGHFIMLMDPGRFGSIDMYKDSIDVYVDSIKNSPRAAGVGEIIIPGELETRSIKTRTENGLDLDESVAASLAQTAAELGLLADGQGFEEMLRWI